MKDARLWKIWGSAEANLKDARRYLVDAAAFANSSEHSLAQFDEYLAHNEFGLALEEIASLADDLPCKAAFWQRLESAAAVMELSEAASAYRERFDAEVRRY